MKHYQESIALGSKSGIVLVTSDSEIDTNAIFSAIWKEIFKFERRFSRFIPASELSILNNKAGFKQPISNEMKDILIAAKDMAIQTKGLYNPFILPALQAAGYSSSRVPNHEKDQVYDYSKRAVAKIEQLEIGDDWARIPYNSALDLGGIGKGYLLDWLKQSIPNKIDGYWISLGGDIALGGNDEDNKPWTVLVEDALNSTHTIGYFTTKGRVGVATSGITVNKGEKAGKQWHHIIDPQTNKPANTDVLLASIYGESSMRADVLASCAVILGADKGMKFLKQHGVKSAVIQYQSDNHKRYIKQFGNNILIDSKHA